MTKIKGGYYIKARKIQESKIASAPPCVREVWDWLLKEANHADKKYKGFILKRGQLFRTCEDIRNGLSWFIGYRKRTYTQNQVKHSLKALRTHLMITSTKKLYGTLITICNYDTYQNPKNYESTNEQTYGDTTNAPIQSTTIYNKKKEERIYIYRAEFEALWKEYPMKDGKDKACAYFRNSVKTDQDLIDIKKALVNYKAHLAIETWKKPKNGKTWFNDWHDWINYKEQKGSHNVPKYRQP